MIFVCSCLYCNDPCLLMFLLMFQVTKIFSKKKSGTTYSFKQSYSLCDMQVYLFETSRTYGSLTNYRTRWQWFIPLIAI